MRMWYRVSLLRASHSIQFRSAESTLHSLNNNSQVKEKKGYVCTFFIIIIFY